MLKELLDNPNWDSKSGQTSSAPYNIGNNNPVKLMDFITAIENKLLKKIQPATYADVNDLGYKPVQEGINKFIWYLVIILW